jgi:hypothetical protein
MEYKWDRFCNRCFNRLKDTAINCDHCGSDFVKKHIVISEIHKKTPDFKIRKNGSVEPASILSIRTSGW